MSKQLEGSDSGTGQQSVHELMQELLAKKACEEVLLRYGRTLDWLDEAGQASCFWPDAYIDYGFFQGSATEWVPMVMQLEQASLHRWHACHSILIAVNGDEAASECYGMAAGSTRMADGRLENHLYGGRYLDRFERREGEWRIIRRKYCADWAQQSDNVLSNIIQQGFAVNVLTIDKPGHAEYQTL